MLEGKQALYEERGQLLIRYLIPLIPVKRFLRFADSNI